MPGKWEHSHSWLFTLHKTEIIVDKAKSIALLRKYASREWIPFEDTILQNFKVGDI